MIMTAKRASPNREPASRAEEILDTAVRLFNEHGVAGMSTNKIADALGMSSGNLHYHFRSKNDVLIAAYRRIETEMREVMASVRAEITPDVTFRWQRMVFELLWKYRFFFGSMDFFLTSSTALYEEYAAFERWIHGRLAELFTESVALGHLRPASPANRIELITDNTWTLWMGWLRWEMIHHRNQPTPEPEQRIILRMVRRHFSFNEPYYDRAHATRVSEIIDQQIA
jgi:AcrR family transcriptional regulator